MCAGLGHGAGQRRASDKQCAAAAVGGLHTLDCNSNRQQQDNLNNNSGTPSAPDSLGEDRGTTGGSGTLAPTTPNDSLSGDDNDGGLGGGGSNGLSGSGSLNGGSSSGGLSD